MDQSQIAQPSVSIPETMVDDVTVKDLFFDAPMHLISNEEHAAIAENLAKAPTTVHDLLQATVLVNASLADIRRVALFHTDWSVDGSIEARDSMRHHAATTLLNVQTLAGLVRRVNREINGDSSVVVR